MNDKRLHTVGAAVAVLPCFQQEIVPFGAAAQKGCFEFKGFELEGSEF